MISEIVYTAVFLYHICFDQYSITQINTYKDWVSGSVYSSRVQMIFSYSKLI